MPYIKQERREDFVRNLDSFSFPIMHDAGELNYVLTKVVQNYIESEGKVNYKVLNEVIGVLECAKQELYRRVVAPYENIKIAENGDVYHADKN